MPTQSKQGRADRSSQKWVGAGFPRRPPKAPIALSALAFTVIALSVLIRSPSEDLTDRSPEPHEEESRYRRHHRQVLGDGTISDTISIQIGKAGAGRGRQAAIVDSQPLGQIGEHDAERIRHGGEPVSHAQPDRILADLSDEELLERLPEKERRSLARYRDKLELSGPEATRTFAGVPERLPRSWRRIAASSGSLVCRQARCES